MTSCVANLQRKNICHDSYLSWMEGFPEVAMVGRSHFFKLICERNLDIIHFIAVGHSLVLYPLQA